MNTNFQQQAGQAPQPDAQQGPPQDPGFAGNPWAQYGGMPPHPAWGMPYYGYPPAAPYMQQAPGFAAQMPPQPAAINPANAQAANPGPADANGFAAALGNMADSSGLGMFKNLFNLDDGDFWKGALVGAAAMLLITNDGLRNSLIGGAAKTAEAVKAGLSGLGDDESADDTSGPDDNDATAEEEPTT